MVYNFCQLCLFVCLSDDNFRKPLCGKFIFAYPVYLQGIWVKFVYEGHWVKVTVTRAPPLHLSESMNTTAEVARALCH